MASYALELQMLMGMRRGEVAPLEWSDIHDDQYILISKEQITVKSAEDAHVEGFAIVSHTKTYKDRIFPVTKEIGEFLTRYRAIHELYFPGNKYLFPSENTENGVITNNVVYQFYARMCKRLGIRISRENIRGPHSFRRNGITKVANNTGGDLLLASQLFGNSPETARQNYYTGLNLEKARSALEG